MVQTWPGAMKPCTRFEGDPRISLTAGGTSTCDTSIEKLVRPRRRACQTAMALAGAVVSKPIPKKTTWRVGYSCASLTASSGE